MIKKTEPIVSVVGDFEKIINLGVHGFKKIYFPIKCNTSSIFWF